jgi:hypothetical protein
MCLGPPTTTRGGTARQGPLWISAAPHPLVASLIADHAGLRGRDRISDDLRMREATGGGFVHREQHQEFLHRLRRMRFIRGMTMASAVFNWNGRPEILIATSPSTTG